MPQLCRTDSTIPTVHEPFVGDTLDEFAARLDDELLHLEWRYSDFWTTESMKKSIADSR